MAISVGPRKSIIGAGMGRIGPRLGVPKIRLKSKQLPKPKGLVGAFGKGKM